jgi:hypothetical protein
VQLDWFIKCRVVCDLATEVTPFIQHLTGALEIALLAPGLKIELGVGFHILPKSGIWLQK